MRCGVVEPLRRCKLVVQALGLFAGGIDAVLVRLAHGVGRDDGIGSGEHSCLGEIKRRRDHLPRALENWLGVAELSRFPQPPIPLSAQADSPSEVSMDAWATRCDVRTGTRSVV